jgi:hypothetical protein
MTAVLLDQSPPAWNVAQLSRVLADGIKDGKNGYREVWCIYYQINGAAVAAWLLTALVVAVIVGLSVGFGVHDGKLGLGVGGTLLTILATIQASIIMWKTY